jgi:hypothetical protein
MRPIYVIESGVRARTATAQRKHIEQLLVMGTVTLLAVQLLQ